MNISKKPVLIVGSGPVGLTLAWRLTQAGLPVVYGEYPDEEVYHYHPTKQQVREWTQQAGLEILKDGDGEIWYYHILVRKV